MLMTENNINTAELNKFSALAADWWDPNGKMKPLHLINPLRLQYIQHQTTLVDQQVVDVGCGGGLLSEAMARQGAKVTGVDMSEALIQVAQNHAQQNQIDIDYRCQSIESLAAEKPHTFDILTCMELLEHVPDPKRMIETCAQLVKPNGKLFFSTINRNPKAYLLAIIGVEHILNWLPPGTHHYAEFIRPAELTRWATAANLTLINFAGMRYHLLKRQFELCDDISVNYLAYFTHEK
jgi:2-polyprenyl-6-hydroxyphenyl methylase/3-demethylubiquinone-9 3-methyltransferase